MPGFALDLNFTCLLGGENEQTINTQPELRLFCLPFLSEEGAEDSLPVHEPCCSTQVRKTTEAGWMCQCCHVEHRPEP